MRSSIIKFCFNFIGFSILIPIIILVVNLVLQVSFSGSGMRSLPFLLAAMLEGQRYVREFGERPTKGEMWRAALLMAWLGMAISLIMGALLLAAIPSFRAEIAQLALPFLLLGVAFVFAIALLLCRVGLGVGVRIAEKELKRVR